MPRVLRKYEHVDFTSLLNEINGTCAKQPDAADVSTKPVPIAAVTEVSPERRRRDSLLSNRNMRYVYSTRDFVLHDRDCPRVSAIQCLLKLIVSGVAIVIGAHITEDHDNVLSGQFHLIAESGHLGSRAVDIAGVVNHSFRLFSM